jgi:cytoskeletal protein CcmA (bactofilin family)
LPVRSADVTVRANTLTIAPGAHINGNIIARSVSLHGHVTGTITADAKLEVASTGSVNGEVTAARMVIEEGAVLDGQVRIGGSTSAS